MTTVTVKGVDVGQVDPAPAASDVAAAVASMLDDATVAQLAGQAREQGVQLLGSGGLLQQLTKRFLEAALDAEMDDHLGYGKHEPAGRNGANSRNGKRGKTLLTDIGPVDIEVPRDRDATFAPAIVAKRQRRLSGIDNLVISLSAKGLTTGEVVAHLAEVYGTQTSKEKVMDSFAEWQARPLDAVYPVVFLDAIHVKIRDGAVANRPIYVALAVTVDGGRDILGLWAGDGGEGAKFWLKVLTDIKKPWCDRCVHGRRRRAERVPRRDQRGLAPNGGAVVHHPLDQGQPALRLEGRLGTHRQRSTAGLHRPD